MALAGRPARRGATGARWLAAGVVVTLLILLVDASLHSRSTQSGQQLAGGEWIDRILPIISTSTAEGQAMADVWSSGLTTSPRAVANQIDQVATGSQQAYDELLKLRPPVDLAGEAGLLETCLLTRSEASATVKLALGQVLGAAGGAQGPASSSSPSPPLQEIENAGSEIGVGDQAYLLFLHDMPATFGVTIPRSQWLADSTPYQPNPAQVFLAALANTVNPLPVHKVKIYSLVTNPSPVSVSGSIRVLPDSSAITLTMVIADVGNQPERNLTVTAAISPPGRGASSVRDFVDLVPGQAHSIVGLGPLYPTQGVPVTLTVTVSPPAGSPTAVITESMVFEMPAPAPTTTSPPTT